MENYIVTLVDADEGDEEDFYLSHYIQFKNNSGNIMGKFLVNCSEFWRNDRQMDVNEIIELFLTMIIAMENNTEQTAFIRCGNCASNIAHNNGIVTFLTFYMMAECTFSVIITDNLIEVFREIVTILRQMSAQQG